MYRQFIKKGFVLGGSSVREEKREGKMMEEIRIGVLAIQGAVEEHINCMKRLGCVVKEVTYLFNVRKEKLLKDGRFVKLLM